MGPRRRCFSRPQDDPAHSDLCLKLGIHSIDPGPLLALARTPANEEAIRPPCEASGQRHREREPPPSSSDGAVSPSTVKAQNFSSAFWQIRREIHAGLSPGTGVTCASEQAKVCSPECRALSGGGGRRSSGFKYRALGFHAFFFWGSDSIVFPVVDISR